MTPALLGKKIGMTRIYDDKGAIVPVTVVQAGPCAITQVKTVDTDGYNAVQLGFGEVKPRHSTMPLIGHCAKSGTTARKHFREIKLKDATDKQPGDTVNVELFTDVKFVDVIGTSKGRGFTGTVRRSMKHQQGVEFEQTMVSDGNGGLCTRHRVSPYLIAAAAQQTGALALPTFTTTSDWKVA